MKRDGTVANCNLLTSGYQPRGLPAGFDEAHDVGRMACVDHRPHPGSRIERIAGLCRRSTLSQLFDENP